MFDDYATSVNCEEVYREDEYEFFHNLYRLLEMENEDGNRE
jgi:hypothetical protein